MDEELLLISYFHDSIVNLSVISSFINTLKSYLYYVLSKYVHFSLLIFFNSCMNHLTENQLLRMIFPMIDFRIFKKNVLIWHVHCLIWYVLNAWHNLILILGFLSEIGHFVFCYTDYLTWYDSLKLSSLIYLSNLWSCLDLINGLI